MEQAEVRAIIANELDENGNEMFLVWWWGFEKPNPQDFVSPHWEPLSTVDGLVELRKFRNSNACQSPWTLTQKLANVSRKGVKSQEKAEEAVLKHFVVVIKTGPAPLLEVALLGGLVTCVLLPAERIIYFMKR